MVHLPENILHNIFSLKNNGTAIPNPATPAYLLPGRLNAQYASLALHIIAEKL